MAGSNRFPCFAIALSLCCGLTLTGCDRATSPQPMDTTNGQPANASVSATGDAAETPSAETPATDPNAVPIDPTLKTVVIAPRAASPDESAMRLRELEEQNAATSERLQTEIGNYSETLTSGGDTGEVSTAMAEDLDSYKQQALEVYKETQRVEAQSNAGEVP